MTEFWDWLVVNLLGNSDLLRTIFVVSFVLFIGALLLLPVVASKIPSDYFSSESRTPYAPENIFLYLLYKIVKNILGVLLIFLGIVLLFTPGQELLSILLGTILLDFPGKFRFQRFLIRKKPIIEGLNWLRRLAGVGPLEI